MIRTKEAREAIEELMYRWDYIVEEHEGKDFIEIVGSIGGDLERRRVYEDGTVYAK